MNAGASQQQWIGSTVLGRYRVVRILAVGGMGAVYLGRAEGARGFVRPVVIKRILATYSDDEEAVSMFVREARILSQLQDPGIVSVIDFGQEEDTLVMVLEYVHGYHLGFWHAFTQKTAGKMDTEDATYIVTRVLDALSHAHNFTHPDGRHVQIIHRDISPSNVLLDIHGNVKLVDFGIARSQGDDVDEYKTQAPRLKGKFSYMCAELFLGEEPSVRSDVYACGVMLYELLSGSNPFRGRTMAESYDKVRTLTPLTLGAIRDDVTEELDNVVAKAMSQDPKRRYASALEFANALRATRVTSDEAVRASLRTRLAEAYAGPLSDLLEIEPLSSRSLAWGDSDHDGDPALEVLDGNGNDGDTAIVDAPAGLLDRTLTSPGPGAPDVTVNVPPPKHLVEESRGTGSRTWVAVAGLVVLAAGAAAFWMGREQGTVEDRVIVIERQTAPAASASAPSETKQAQPTDEAPSTNEAPDDTAAAQAETATGPTAPVEGTTTKRAKVSTHTRTAEGPDPRNLTRAFSRQQGKVEQCFVQFPDQVGNQNLSIKFQISTGGTVETAELSPPAVASTALGRCLVAVAKGATFPAQQQSIAFRIPITARLVK